MEMAKFITKKQLMHYFIISEVITNMFQTFITFLGWK